MIIRRKQDVLELNDDELTSLFLGVEKIAQRNTQMGFVKRLDLTWDEEKVFSDLYRRLAPSFGVDANAVRKEVNIAHNSKTTEWRA